ncbi:MAG: EamA family transporter [Proteobacteria bacterium]|nr:EamA family transporter [Pseudomonadota bacterium]
MPDQITPGARVRITPAGLLFLATTSVGWGLNWPATKYLLSELPPLTLRGVTGVAGAALLAIVVLACGQSLQVERALWPRLCLYAFLNVTCWMALVGVALLWLPAGEASMIAYTMPVWASLLAWPILGERPNLLRVIALLLAFGGLTVILGGGGISITPGKLTGFVMVLGGAFAFALGAVLSKKWPLPLPPMTAAAWQIGLGCLPVGLVGALIETSHFEAVTPVGWWLLGYSTVIQFCVAYVSWFAALNRLPASIAAIGTTAVPVIGVVASAIALHEPLGLVQIAALLLTLGGVVLATRS